MGIFLLGETIGTMGIIGMIFIQFGLFFISKDKKKQL